eukprot:gene17304-biopygen11069
MRSCSGPASFLERLDTSFSVLVTVLLVAEQLRRRLPVRELEHPGMPPPVVRGGEVRAALRRLQHQDVAGARRRDRDLLPQFEAVGVVIA